MLKLQSGAKAKLANTSTSTRSFLKLPFSRDEVPGASLHLEHSWPVHQRSVGHGCPWPRVAVEIYEFTDMCHKCN